jgi:subtilisin family serine protease
MQPLDLIRLAPLMAMTGGRPEIVIGLIDGPVALTHPDIVRQNVRELAGVPGGNCSSVSNAACVHGTFVTGILAARRGSAAPAICPGCTLLLRPIFQETTNDEGHLPSATPETLAAAIVQCVDAGAQVVNISAALTPSWQGQQPLEHALDHCARRRVMIVAAAGNHSSIGSTAITRHSWVIPVVGCDLTGRPLDHSNLGASIGRRGLRAPGTNVTSLGTSGKSLMSSGTSVATPFVTGTIALVWSVFPDASAADIRLALTYNGLQRRTSIVPPLLDAWGAYESLLQVGRRAVTV